MVNITDYALASSLNLSTNPMATIWSYGDTLTNGFLSISILPMLFFISYVSLSGSGFKEHAMVSSAFLCAMVAFLLMYAGVMNPLYFIVSVIVLVIAARNSARLNSQS